MGAYTYEEFKDEVIKREFAAKSRQYKGLVDHLEAYMNTNEILSFYPKNLRNSLDKEFFIFTESLVTIVTPHAQEKQEYVIRSFKRELTEMTLELPEYDVHGVKLKLKNGNEDLEFNSINDSGSYWNEIYVENIKEICKLYTSDSSNASRTVEA